MTRKGWKIWGKIKECHKAESFDICDTEKNEASCEQILFRTAVYYTQVL